MTDIKTPPPPVIRLMCRGWRWNGEMLYQLWTETDVGPDTAPPEHIWGGKGLVPYASPGQMYDFSIAKVDERGKMTSVYTSGQWRPQYAEMYEGPEVAVWSMESRAAKLAEARHREAKNGKSKDPVVALLLDARRRLDLNKDPFRRQALLEVMTLELRRPLTKAERDAQ